MGSLGVQAGRWGLWVLLGVQGNVMVLLGLLLWVQGVGDGSLRVVLGVQGRLLGSLWVLLGGITGVCRATPRRVPG